MTRDESLNDVMDTRISLTDENGNEVEFELLACIAYKDDSYIILLPVDEEETDVVILKIESDDYDSDIETYVSVEDDEILENVFAIFKKNFSHRFNFI